MHPGDRILDLVNQYCLCQRLKPFGSDPPVFATHEAYVEALVAHHALVIAAMHCKQSVDIRTVDELDRATSLWSKMYIPLPPANL